MKRLWGVRASVPGGAVGRRLALMALIDATGTGAFLAVSAIFLTRSVGLTVAQVGVGLSTGAVLALLTSIPIGAIADRYGPRRVLVAISLWRGACFVAYPFVGGFPAFLLVVCLLGLVDKAAAPMEQALVGMAVRESERVRTMAVMRSVRNVGFTLGALLGTAALAMDTRPAYAALLFANAASFLALAAAARRLPLLVDQAGPVARRPVSFRVLADRPYLALATLNAVLTLHMTLLSVGIPVWIVAYSNAPRSIVAVLLAINTILAVVLQVRVSGGVDDTRGASRALMRAGIALAVCCALLAALPALSRPAAIALAVAAAVALTAGELLQSAGGWSLSYILAREGQQAAYLSLFWLGVAVQQIAAPVVVALVVGAGPVGWIVLGATLGLTGLLVPGVTRWAVSARAGELISRSGKPTVIHRELEGAN